MNKNLKYLLVLPLMFLAACSKEDPQATLTVKTTVTGQNYYQGLTLQMGLAGSTNAIAETTVGTNGEAVFETDVMPYTSKEMWFCVPKMVKFFHTITDAEAAAKTIVLPDKDAGSTLDATGVKNDWIVGLYLGVNKDGKADGAPLYWATGNLLAVKTNAPGEASKVAYHIGTAQETEEEGTVGNSLVGLDERLVCNVPDSYINMPAGSKWDQFGFGDPTGLMLYDNMVTAQYCIDGGQMKQDSTDIVFNISGDPRFDAARAQLGGLWRLPTCGKTGQNEFAAFEDDCDEYAGLLPDGQLYGTEGVSFGVEYRYTVEVDGKAVTVNTLKLPAGGFRHANDMYSGIAQYSLYWSGTADPTGTAPFVPGKVIEKTMPPYFTAFNYGYLDERKTWFPHPRSSTQTIRPVTE